MNGFILPQYTAYGALQLAAYEDIRPGDIFMIGDAIRCIKHAVMSSVAHITNKH